MAAASMTPAPMVPKTNFGTPAIVGFLALVVLVGGSVTWASLAKISGAAIASGSVIVEGKPKSIQHLDGGIVKRILVSPGQRVERKQLLVMLDDTSIAANLAIYVRRLREAVVRRERLNAELEGKGSFAIPNKLLQLFRLGDGSETAAQQMTLLKARRQTLSGQEAQFDEKVAQFENQIAGITGLIREKHKQVKAYREEIAPISELVRDNLAARSRLLGLERSRDELLGQIAEHTSEIARLKNSIAETRLAKLQVGREFRERTITELEKAEAQIDELRQQMEATRKQLARVEIRSPVAGIVHEQALYTVGGVVQAGQTVMQIIPQSEAREIEVNIDPTLIDQIQPGGHAIVRFPAFHQRTTPELDGRVGTISPSSVVDEKTGQAFYRVEIIIDDKELSRLGDKKLIPGMPVEAFFPNEERTVLSYLIKPLVDHLQHALREQ